MLSWVKSCGPIVETTGIVCMWIVTTLRAPQALRQPRQRSFWIAVVAIAAAMTLYKPPITIALQRLLSDGHTIDVTRHALAVTASVFVLHGVLGAIGYRNQGPPLYLLGGAVMALLLWFDVTAPPHARNLPTTAELPTTYWLIFYGFHFTADATCTYLCLRTRAHADQPLLRTSLLLFGLGMAVAAVALWPLFIGYTLTHQAALLTLTPLVTGVESLLMASGVSIPLISVVLDSARNRTTLWRLWPLWNEFVQAVPEVSPVQPRNRIRELLLPPQPPGVRLYRAIIEIRDVALSLRDYASSTLLQRADDHTRMHNVPANKHEAIVMACWLKAAHEAKTRAAKEHPHNLNIPGGDDLKTEVRFLIDVADAYQSRIASAFIGRIKSTSSHGSVE